MPLDQVEVVHRLRDVQVRVRVESLYELRPLILKVALDLELVLEVELVRTLFLEPSAELVVHRLVGKVRYVPDHPRYRKALLGLGVLFEVFAAAPVGGPR